jgi:hypothetical protein
MLVVGLAVLPRLGSAQGMGAGEAATMLSLLTVPSTLLPLLAARIARRWARPLVTIALFTCAVTTVVLQATNHPAALLLAAAVIGLCLGLTEGVPDGQALHHVPSERGGAGAALFSTTRMSLETFTLAAATGSMTAFGPSSGLAVAGGVCLIAAFVVRQAVPAPALGRSGGVELEGADQVP